MWVRSTETEQTFERLRRIVEVPLFRFVIIQALPQPDVFRDISDFLKKTFPERPRKEVNLLKTDYWALLKEFDEAQEGFVLLRNFEHLLHEPDLYVGFNQRRDRFASKPLTIIALLPTGIEVMRLLQDRIPDFWSLRAGTLEFRYRYLPEIKTYYQPRFRNPEPDTRTVEDKKQTLDELSQRLADLQADAQNIDAIVSASSELTLLCKDLGRPTDALHYTNIGLTLVNSSSLVSEQYYALSFLLLKADTLIEQGAFEAVEPVLAEAENLALKLEDRPLWYEAQYLRALRLLEKLQADDAPDFLEQVLRQADEEPIALEINTLVKLQTLHGLAHIQSGEWDTAYRLLNQYVNEAKEKYLSKHIGAILFGTKNVAEVLRKFGDSVFILKGGEYTLTKTLQESTADYPFSELLWGSSWFFKGLSTEFETHFDNALRVFTVRYGRDHVLVGDTCYHWGQYLFFYQGPYHQFVPGVQNQEFDLWERKDRAPEAKESLQKALAKFEQAKVIYQNYYIEKHPKIIYIETFIAFIHLHLKDFATAKVEFERILYAEENKDFPSDYLTAICNFGIGQIYEQRKWMSKATTYYYLADRQLTGNASTWNPFSSFLSEPNNISRFMMTAHSKSPKTFFGRFWERLRYRFKA